MRLLLSGIMRRHKPMQLLAVVMVAGTWYMVGGEDAEAVSVAISVPLCAAFMIGPGRMSVMVPPAVSYLPLSRRDIWRATWLASVLWPTAVVTATMLLMMLVPATRATMGLSGVALSAAYAFAYSGAGCVLLMLMATTGSHPRIWRPLRDVISAMIPLVALGGFYLSVWGRRFIGRPTQWSEFSPSGTVWLVSAIGLATAAYFYSPPVTGTPPDRVGNRRDTAERAAARSVLPSRLTGLPRLLWNEYAWTMAIAGGVVLVLAAAVVAIDMFYNTERLAAGVVRNQLVQLFDRTSAGPEFGFGYIFWLIMFFLATVARFGFIIRHLRVLPVSPLQLNAIFVAWPAAVLVTAWSALLAAYVLVVGRPVTSLSLGILLSLIGSSALTRSIGLRWQQGWASIICLALMSGVLAGLPMPRLPAQPLLLGGIASLIVAALLNRATLAHSAAYRRPTVALGLPPPR